MKTHTFLTSLAATAGLLGLTACDSEMESLNMKNCDLQTEAAELLLDCESAEDVEAAIDELKALAEEGREIEKEIKKNDSEFEKFMEEEISELEAIRIENRLRIAKAKAEGLMKDAMLHVIEVCKDDKDTLNKIMDALKD